MRANALRIIPVKIYVVCTRGAPQKLYFWESKVEVFFSVMHEMTTQRLGIERVEWVFSQFSCTRCVHGLFSRAFIFWEYINKCFVISHPRPNKINGHKVVYALLMNVKVVNMMMMLRVFTYHHFHCHRHPHHYYFIRMFVHDNSSNISYVRFYLY